MPSYKTKKSKINTDEFEKLCVLHCTLVEIAGFFDCSEDTVESWCKETYGMLFSEIYKRKSAKGNISLRRAQFQAAEAGNMTAAIWLGKQWLDQAEKQELSVAVNDDDTIKEMEKYFEHKQAEHS